jgi:hypothetical protein
MIGIFRIRADRNRRHRETKAAGSWVHMNPKGDWKMGVGWNSKDNHIALDHATDSKPITCDYGDDARSRRSC